MAFMQVRGAMVKDAVERSINDGYHSVAISVLFTVLCAGSLIHIDFPDASTQWIAGTCFQLAQFF